MEIVNNIALQCQLLVTVIFTIVICSYLIFKTLSFGQNLYKNDIKKIQKHGQNIIISASAFLTHVPVSIFNQFQVNHLYYPREM
jgi:hypothetical protein